MITLYSTNCPKCKVIEQKLNIAKINFDLNTNQEDIVELGRKNKILSAPILVVDDLVMDFKAANDWIKSH